MPTINSPHTPYTKISDASTNSTLVKTGSTNLYGISVFNINAAVRYIKFYNKATAPTIGTDTPVFTFGIPANSGNNITFPKGITFNLGLCFGLTTGISNSDTGAVSASETAVNLWYV